MPSTSQFGGSDFSIDSAQTLELDMNSFLSGSPDDVTEIKDEDKKDPKKPIAKKTPSTTEEGDKEEEKVETPISFTADEFFDVVDKETEDEDNEDSTDETDKEDKKTPKKPEEKKDEDPEESTYALLTKELLTLGVFTPDEDDEGNEVIPEATTPQEFLGLFQTEVKKQAGLSVSKFIEQFGPEYQEMFQAVFVDAVPPYDYISRQAKIENIENYDITIEENQEKIVRQWYKSQGIPQEKIEAKIQKLKNYSDLEEEAGVAKGILIEKEQTDLQNLAAQKKREIENKQRLKQEYTANIQKILGEKIKAKDFDGIPVEGKFAKQTYDYLTKDVYQLKDKTLLTEFDKEILDLNRPENNATKIKVAMLLQLLKTDPTLSKLGKRAVSKESNELFQKLEKKMGKVKAAPEKEENKFPSRW